MPLHIISVNVSVIWIKKETFTKNAVITNYHYVERKVKVWVSLVKLGFMLMNKNSIFLKGGLHQMSDMTSSLLILPLPLQAMESSEDRSFAVWMFEAIRWFGVPREGQLRLGPA